MLLLKKKKSKPSLLCFTAGPRILGIYAIWTTHNHGIPTKELLEYTGCARMSHPCCDNNTPSLGESHVTTITTVVTYVSLHYGIFGFTKSKLQPRLHDLQLSHAPTIMTPSCERARVFRLGSSKPCA